MLIMQRSFLQVTTFQFDAETLTHVRSDSHGSHSLTLPYGSIGMEMRVCTEYYEAFLSGGILLLLWGLGQAIYAILHSDLLGSVYFLPGILSLLLHGITKTTVTYLNSDAGEIAIFHGNQHDIIVAEIRERRKTQLLQWYGNINFANNPEDEIRKFTWLHSQNLIDATQLQQIITAIRTAAKSSQDESDEPSLPRQ